VTKRKRLPLRWAKALLKRQGGKCAVAKCGVVLVLGPKGQHVNFIDEHVVPRALGGKDTFKNRELRCIAHANEKTTKSRYGSLDSDARLIRKLRHIKTGKMKVNRGGYVPGATRKEVVAFIAKRWPKRPFPKMRRPL
jgi:hypothetical protein